MYSFTNVYFDGVAILERLQGKNENDLSQADQT
jgi:hypothetical protein